MLCLKCGLSFSFGVFFKWVFSFWDLAIVGSMGAILFLDFSSLHWWWSRWYCDHYRNYWGHVGSTITYGKLRLFFRFMSFSICMKRFCMKYIWFGLKCNKNTIPMLYILNINYKISIPILYSYTNHFTSIHTFFEVKAHYGVNKKLSQFDSFWYLWNFDISWWMFGKK